MKILINKSEKICQKKGAKTVRCCFYSFRKWVVFDICLFVVYMLCDEYVNVCISTEWRYFYIFFCLYTRAMPIAFCSFGKLKDVHNLLINLTLFSTKSRFHVRNTFESWKRKCTDKQVESVLYDGMWPFQIFVN